MPNEAINEGLIQNRWMYPIERYIGALKKYICNRVRPKGSIAEGYIINEALTFCLMHFHGLETRFNRDYRHMVDNVDDIRGTRIHVNFWLMYTHFGSSKGGSLVG